MRVSDLVKLSRKSWEQAGERYRRAVRLPLMQPENGAAPAEVIRRRGMPEQTFYPAGSVWGAAPGEYRLLHQFRGRLDLPRSAPRLLSSDEVSRGPKRVGNNGDALRHFNIAAKEIVTTEEVNEYLPRAALAP